MEKSLILAELWGWYMVLFFALMMINTKRIKQIYDYMTDEKLLFIASFIAIIIGLLSVLYHNIWASDWRILLTLLGWLCLLKGFLFFSFPKLVNQKIITFSVKNYPYLLIFMLFMGIFFLNKVYHFIIY